jgi:hypothetical protein
MLRVNVLQGWRDFKWGSACEGITLCQSPHLQSHSLPHQHLLISYDAPFVNLAMHGANSCKFFVTQQTGASGMPLKYIGLADLGQPGHKCTGCLYQQFMGCPYDGNIYCMHGQTEHAFSCMPKGLSMPHACARQEGQAGQACASRIQRQTIT